MEKATLTPQQKEAIKLAKKMSNKAVNALYAICFDNEIRNKRYFEIKAIELDAIVKIKA